MTSSRLLFIQLNEINFDFVRHYVAQGQLPTFRRILASFGHARTIAEQAYVNIEPWIQWVSIHTGKTFEEHGIFRLGDITKAPDDLVQLFEELEDRGYRVGALSPMNAANRLRNPAFFIPDPWTQTPSDGSPLSRRVHEMLRQTVNDNAVGKVSRTSLLTLVELGLRTLHWRRSMTLLRIGARALRRRWYRSMFLDYLIHLTHLYLLRTQKCDVSFVFFNAGAHIQHHYLLNSTAVAANRKNPPWYVAEKHDPIFDMLKIYDDMIADYLRLSDKGDQIILATALKQVPYDRAKIYYRLIDHADFLRALGIAFDNVLPRMTRDFELTFDDQPSRDRAAELLAAVTLERTGEALFGDIDCRGGSLFASFTYPNELRAGDAACLGAHRLDDLQKRVAFVAIKNGMHDPGGEVFFTPLLNKHAPGASAHVSALFDFTLKAADMLDLR